MSATKRHRSRQRHGHAFSPSNRTFAPPTIDHRECRWDPRSEIATAPFGIFLQKNFGFFPKKLEASPTVDIPPSDSLASPPSPCPNRPTTGVAAPRRACRTRCSARFAAACPAGRRLSTGSRRALSRPRACADSACTFPRLCHCPFRLRNRMAHSALMPAALTIGHHFAASAF